ncbi:MAG: hypothetical protein ACK58O_00850 [Brevundimonas sp.]
MFVGHYGLALAVAGGRRSPPLGLTFVAVQAMDFGCFGLSLAGIERWRPVADLPGLNPFELSFMPYTHSLTGAALIGLTFGVLCALAAPRAQRPVWFGLLAALVLSHWGLDFLVHRPDLPLLIGDGARYGLGFWNDPRIAIPLEMAVLFGGAALYARRTRSAGAGPGRYALPAMILVLLGLQAFNWFGPAITDPLLFPLAGLGAYVVATALAIWTGRSRRPAEA